MFATLKRLRFWLLAWAVLSTLSGVFIARNELARQQGVFDTNARIVHRLLSQRVVQHDAILATLALLHSGTATDRPEQRLPALYTQIAAAAHRGPDEAWPTPSLTAAEAESRRLKRAVLADVDLQKGMYQLVLAAQPDSYALTISMRNMVPWTEWPMAAETSPVQVRLQLAQARYVVQAGRAFAPGDAGWTFEARKVLAADSQPFEVVSQLHLGWAALPWAWMLLSAGAIALILMRAHRLAQQRVQQRREEERQRVGQLTRLNTLGELAAGMAHEINQPLTAILANTQAASRMLDDAEPDLPAARNAMHMAVQQARRASDVVGRLRRTVERPGSGAAVQSVNLHSACRHALYLLEPELQRNQCAHTVTMDCPAFEVLVDPVALEQIIHNLLTNALQAMEQVPPENRTLQLVLTCDATFGKVRVQDSGPGIAPDALAKVFEPFFSTREGGLGLGLSLCETLAVGMSARLSVANRAPQGAEFTLQIPLAHAADA
jgi:C4-dicarboxylate-specific signal transduction histidine kinase